MAACQPEKESIRVCIRGRVQGVWFRGWTEQEAVILGLSGWVRNCPDGSVEALFCGRKEAVQEMIEKCASGPNRARVDEVIILGKNEPTPAGFCVLRSANS